MALAVDTSGKTKASPTTGKVMSSGSSSALSDIISNAIDQITSGVSSVANDVVGSNEAAVAGSQETTTTERPRTLPMGSISGSMGRSSLPSYQPVGLSGATGSTLGSGRLANDEMSLLDWERKNAEEQGRDTRDENVFGEEYEDTDRLVSSFGDSQSEYVGNTPQNDVYIRNAIDSGLSMDDAWAIMHRPTTIDEDREMRDSMDVADDVIGEVGHVIDDGTSYDYAHMTSDWMTGPQYKRYVEMGMGGRPVDDIDMAGAYNKKSEAMEYGFMPFTPDDSTYMTQVVDERATLPSKVGSYISGLRTNNPLSKDYTITYGEGDDRKTINGREFDELANRYLNQFYYDLSFHPENLEPLVSEHAIPNKDGGISYTYGDVVSHGFTGGVNLTYSDGHVEQVPLDEVNTWETDSDGLVIPEEYYTHGDMVSASMDDAYYITFSDGQTVAADYEKMLGPDGNLLFDTKSIAADDAQGRLPDDLDSIAVGYTMPDLVMSDGTAIPFHEVQRIYGDDTARDDEDFVDVNGDTWSDDDIEYDFNDFLLFDDRPARLMNQEMIDLDADDKFDTSDLSNNLLDWSFGSLPISIGRTFPWVYSASQGATAMTGVNPRSFNSGTNSYSLSAGDWDENGNLVYGVRNDDGSVDKEKSDSTKNWSALGNFAVPLTEQLVGPVGEGIIPVGKVFGKTDTADTVGQLVKNFLIGAAEEGIEEDLGNLFEELTDYGRDAFADPVLDKDGNVVKDVYQHEKRDSDTPFGKRFMNFVNPNDLANSFLGGVGVDLMMDLGLSPTPFGRNSFTRQVVPTARNQLIRSRYGISPYVETDAEREIREAIDEGRIPDLDIIDVDDEFLSNFDDDRRL